MTQLLLSKEYSILTYYEAEVDIEAFKRIQILSSIIETHGNNMVMRWKDMKILRRNVVACAGFANTIDTFYWLIWKCIHALRKTELRTILKVFDKLKWRHRHVKFSTYFCFAILRFWKSFLNIKTGVDVIAPIYFNFQIIPT